MPRPKGSKNKTKKMATTKDYAALISEKQAEKEAIAEEVNAINENISALKADLKTKMNALKAAEKEIAKLEKQRADMEAALAEEEKKEELNETLQKLMDSGMSAAEILEKLK